MKNCRLNLSITNFNTSNEVIEIPIEVNLTPLYITPEEVLIFFAEEGSKDWIENYEKILMLIFNGSKSFDRLLASLSAITSSSYASLISAYSERYTICYATYWAGIKLFKDRLVSISKQKTLGDFNVSYRAEKEELPITSIIKDAKDCLDNIKKEIYQLIQADRGKSATFGLRKFNAKVSVFDTRRWDNQNPEFGIAYAGNKRTLQDGRSYKTGAYYQYWMIGKLGYENWGYDGYYTW